MRARRSSGDTRGPRNARPPRLGRLLPDVPARFDLRWRERQPTARCPGKPGHDKAPWTIRQDHPGGKDPATGPTMQPNTVNTHHQTNPPARAPDPAELLETVARALATALIPLPRQPEPPAAEQPADFLTAAQLARRLGISRETVRRLAIAGALPHTVVCRGARKTTRRFQIGRA